MRKHNTGASRPLITALLQLNQLGFDHAFVAIACFVIAGVIGSFLIVQSHAYTNVWKGVLTEGSATSGFCLTAAGSTNGTKVVLDPCSKTSDNNQIWSLNAIKTATVLGKANVQEFTLQSAAGTTECLNNPYGSKTNGTALQLYTCHSNDNNSLWVWGSGYTAKGLSSHQLINIGSILGNKGLCLDDAYGNTHRRITEGPGLGLQDDQPVEPELV